MVLVIQKHARRTSENNMVNDCLRKKGGDRFFETSLKKTSIKKISATNESDPIIEDLKWRDNPETDEIWIDF